MKLIEAIEDIFDCEGKHCLAHCVSRDMKPNSALAERFQRRYGCPLDQPQQHLHVGDVCALGTGVYYLIVKDLHWQQARIDDIMDALVQLRGQMVDRGQKRVAIPRLGCDEGIDWRQMRRLLMAVFQDTDIEILVCLLDTID